MTTTCTHRNGTYACTLPAGHNGAHEARTISAGETLIARWTTVHGTVKFFRRTR